MAINFPDSPSAGDPHTEAGVTWTYDGEKWVSDNTAAPAPAPALWTRAGTVLSPATAGDDVTTTGDLSAAAGTFTGGFQALNVVRDSTGATASSGIRLVNNNNNGCLIQSTSNASNEGGLQVLSYDGGSLSDARFRIESNGDTKIGGDLSNNPNITLNAQGNYIGYRASASSAASVLMLRTDIGGTKADTFGFYCDGSAKKPGGGSWGAMSDRRVKEDIADYSASLSSILQLTPRSYRYVGNPQTYIGLIAQEAEGAMPELVTKGEGTLPDGTEVDDFRTLDQTPLTFALINAVKEMATRIEALEAEVQALKGGS